MGYIDLKRDLLIFFTFVIAILILFYSAYFLIDLNVDYNLDIVIPLLILSIIFQKLRKHHRLKELGLSVDKNVVQNIFSTIVIAFVAVIFISLMLLMSAGGIDETRFISNFSLQKILHILSLVAIEELIFRGLAFQIIEENLGKISALIVSSIIFTMAHIFNPAITFVAYINIFLAGILFGIMYIKSRSLYPPIIFHFIWNFSSVYIFNSPLSGVSSQMGLINYDFYANYGLSKLFYGSNFGIEEGLLATPILVFSIILSVKLLVENPYITSLNYKRKFS